MVLLVCLNLSHEKNPSAISTDELRKYSEEGTIELLPQTDDVNGLLEKADVVVLPSFYNEGIPRILLEGLSKGMPIITTNSVGCKETVVDKQNGYLIEPRNSGALDTAIREMIALSEEKRDKMRMESRYLAETQFDENKVIENYINIIEAPTPIEDNFAIKPLGAQ